ncbi:hypothetical protein GJ496_009996 [Pomphorhynchus laevis]|nr:hypothetical protein GJ496_009996 [Pomphorhynchus laevis]
MLSSSTSFEKILAKQNELVIVLYSVLMSSVLLILIFLFDLQQNTIIEASRAAAIDDGGRLLGEANNTDNKDLLLTFMIFKRLDSLRRKNDYVKGVGALLSLSSFDSQFLSLTVLV